MKEKDTVFLMTADDTAIADMVEAVLGDNGIPVLRKDHTELFLRVILGSANGIDIYVPKEALEKATALTAELFSDDSVLTEQEDCS